ncbi:MAG TPA: acyl-CoA dehydrogenase family protein [Phenylobacterium sp.]|jgi:alkylation response protein AidB-like acyl-CoA dehydrogenase|uniref:acyl-CoA dehydrogenase family protein n=1 Tax=Phenylobacterium sp. TaxID=1871053 RepID=UPI002D68F67D|nr:acyl-CoA dehydrogenase family protein [Phenylobacterium sp.]HZZ69152.1 acyl-CoA dehydrogenase family protein [Phenylobacterium sp.]
MDFSITADQRMMQESLARTLAEASSLDRVRKFAGDLTDQGGDIWRAMADFGLAGIVVPEEHGGLGLSLLDAALASEALGAAVAPVPFMGVVLGPLALLRGGSAAQQAEWLPKLASGQVVAVAAISEPIAGARDGAGVTATDGKLSGKALFAPGGMASGLLIVADRTGSLHLVRGDAAGLTRSLMKGIDETRRLAELDFDNTPAEPLSGGPELLARLRDAGWVLVAADSLGAAQVMLDKAVAYAKERRQFDRVIGSFQAVKHMCAEMAAELEPCRSLVWYAAYAFDSAPAEASLMAAHAKALTSEVGRFVARTATEVHGGMGITDLLGLHFWFKRLGLNRQLLGGPERVREIAARLQGLAA